MNIAFTENTHPGTLPPSDQLGFGSVFTDHMFLMDYSAGKGWHDARIVPYGPISLSPAASVLHYGTEVFEGLKAYRRPDGGVQLFRPWENVARLNRSCERLGLPQVNPRQEMLRRYYDAQNGAGFDYAYRWPGMNKVLQAAGRVIRTQEDKGVVLLLDDRFAQSEYARLFPKHWRHLEYLRDTEELKKKLAEFWGK